MIEADEIQRWHPDGRYDTTIYRKEYTAEIRSELVNQNKSGLRGFQIIDDSVYFYSHELDGNLVLHKVKNDGGKEETLLSVPVDGTIADVCGIEPGKIYFALNDGIIRYIDSDKTIKEFIPGRLAGESLNTYSYHYKNGNLFFLDVFSHVIFRTDNASILERIKVDNLQPYGYDDKTALISMFSSGFDGKICAVEKNSGNIIVFDSQKKSLIHFDSLKKNGWMIAFSVVVIFSGLAGFISIILLIYYIFAGVFNRKIPLIFKSTVIYLPIILTGLYITLTIFFNSFNTLIDEENNSRFSQMAQFGAKFISADDLASLHSLRDYNSESYERLKSQMNLTINNNQDPWNADLNVYLYKTRDDGIFYIIDSFGFDFLFPYAVQPAHADVFRDGKIRTARYVDESGEWISGISPVISSTGKIVGIYEVSKKLMVAAERQKQFRNGLILSIVYIVVPMLVIFAIMSYFLLRNIRKLHKSISEVAKKNFDVSVKIRSRDEIEDLGNGFNAMSRELNSYISEINLLHSASMRFVPKQFLKFLNKRKLSDVNLGDQINLEMTILFSDIRNFTTLSEDMTPEETFNFINSYLNCMGPVISRNHGFIDKYIGDAIMALFPDFADSAILAAIDMQKMLVQFNSERKMKGLSEIAIGIGLHSGDLMLGIIGEEERIDSTVLSDAVNLASRLESLTKHYHTSIIVSGDVLDACIKPERFNSRLIDRVIVKGKSGVISIYEIFDGDDETQVALKKAAMPVLMEAYALYQKADFATSRELFKSILIENPDDAIAKIYDLRCDKMMQGQVPEDWDGITVYSSK